MTKAPEDVLKVAGEIEWDDLMAVGFDKAGRCVVLSSQIGCAEALLLAEMLRQGVLSEILAARPKYDA